MDYTKFKLVFMSKVCDALKKRGINRNLVKFYSKGYTSDIKEERDLIIDANLRYFGARSSSLMGDIIVVRTGGDGHEICRFEMKGLFKIYIREGFDSVIDVMESNITLLRAMNNEKIVDNMLNYSFAKKRLIVKLVTGNDIEEKTNMMLHRVIGDICQAVFIVLYENKDGRMRKVGTAMLPEKIIRHWGVTEEEVWRAAFANTKKHFPPVLFPCSASENRVSMLIDSDFMRENPECLRLNKYDVPALTTGAYNDGAVAIFYPGVGERMAKLFGESYYVVFTSENEVRLHAVESVSLTAIKNMMESLSGVLSKMVYKFDIDKGDIVALS